MNIMLVIVLGIFGGYIYMGTRMGLMKMAFGLFSSILLLGISFLISPTISTRLENNPKVMSYVEKKIDRVYESYEELKEEREEKTEKKNEGKKAGEKEGKRERRGKRFAQEVVEKLTKAYAAHLAVRTFVFVGVYLVASLILFVTEKFLCLIAKLPVLNSLNRLAGGGLGAIKALLVVWLFFMVLTIFLEHEIAKQGLRQIGENTFLRILYDNNMIVKLIANFI